MASKCTLCMKDIFKVLDDLVKNDDVVSLTTLCFLYVNFFFFFFKSQLTTQIGIQMCLPQHFNKQPGCLPYMWSWQNYYHTNLSLNGARRQLAWVVIYFLKDKSENSDALNTLV